jgi:hypothetical protein
MHPGDKEAARGGVLGGVVDGAGANVIVHPLVHGHNVARVVLVSLYPLLDAAALRRAPVIVPVIIDQLFKLLISPAAVPNKLSIHRKFSISSSIFTSAFKLTKKNITN